MQKDATKNMYRYSKKVTKHLKHKAGHAHVGDLVHIPLVQQDRCKVDANDLTGVIVNIKQCFGGCQAVVKSGLLRPRHLYYKLRDLPAGSSIIFLNMHSKNGG